MEWFRDRAVTLVLMAMFLVFLVAQMVTGLYEYNATPHEHGQPLVSITGYLATGHPWEALFEINRDAAHRREKFRVIDFANGVSICQDNLGAHTAGGMFLLATIGVPRCRMPPSRPSET